MMASNADVSLTELRACVQMILMECLVRRVTPTFFAGIIDDTEELLTDFARLEAAVYVKNVLQAQEPGRVPVVLDAAMVRKTIEISALRAKLAAKTYQMAECREEPDSKVS
jgi:hypothetical protein